MGTKAFLISVLAMPVFMGGGFFAIEFLKNKGGVEEKKIVGNKCTSCGNVFVPPRKICGKCKIELSLDENWVDLPDTGTLVNYTMTPYRVSDRRARTVKTPDIIGMIQIDGSNSAIVYKLLDIVPADVKTGMKVKVEWNKKLKGDPSDIKGFVKA